MFGSLLSFAIAANVAKRTTAAERAIVDFWLHVFSYLDSSITSKALLEIAAHIRAHNSNSSAKRTLRAVCSDVASEVSTTLDSDVFCFADSVVVLASIKLAR